MQCTPGKKNLTHTYTFYFPFAPLKKDASFPVNSTLPMSASHSALTRKINSGIFQGKKKKKAAKEKSRKTLL